MEHLNLTKEQLLRIEDCSVFFVAADDGLEMFRYCLETWNMISEDFLNEALLHDCPLSVDILEFLKKEVGWTAVLVRKCHTLIGCAEESMLDSLKYLDENYDYQMRMSEPRTIVRYEFVHELDLLIV